MLPGKYQIKVTSYGHSVPVFNNYAWPSSGIVQVCTCLAIPILHSCSLTRSLTHAWRLHSWEWSPPRMHS